MIIYSKRVFALILETIRLCLRWSSASRTQSHFPRVISRAIFPSLLQKDLWSSLVTRNCELSWHVHAAKLAIRGHVWQCRMYSSIRLRTHGKKWWTAVRKRHFFKKLTWFRSMLRRAKNNSDWSFSRSMNSRREISGIQPHGGVSPSQHLNSWTHHQLDAVFHFATGQWTLTVH